MFNPVIVVAIILQGLVSKANRLAGAIVGYIVTAGILIWGLGAYGEGNAIQIFGIELSQEVFVIVCLVWFGFDTKALVSALKESKALKEAVESPLMQDPRVIGFYDATQAAWTRGDLDGLSSSFKSEATRLTREELARQYPPTEGGALSALFAQFAPLDGEYLVGVSAQAFVLTNLRLIQKDGRDQAFREVRFADAESFELKGFGTKTLTFKMRSGPEVVFEKLPVFPAENYLSHVMTAGAMVR